jgi:hypothetical protein
MRTLKYYRQLATEVPGPRAVVVSEPDAPHAAKEPYAHAETLTSDGRYAGFAANPHRAHAQYFSVLELRDGGPRAVATVRVTYVNPDSGFDSFPYYDRRALSPKYRKLLDAADPAACGEISGLVRKPAVSGKAALMLYRAVWHYALSRRYEYLLMSYNASLYRRCKIIFGKSWIKAGPRDYSKNISEIPVMIDVRGSLDAALTLSHVNPLKRHIQLKALQFFLSGLPEDVILPAHRVKLNRYRLRTAASAPAHHGP